MIISVMYYLSGYTNFVGLIASEAGRWMRTKKRSGLGQATKIIVYKSWGELSLFSAMQNMHIWTARVITSKIKLIYETKQKN